MTLLYRVIFAVNDFKQDPVLWDRLKFLSLRVNFLQRTGKVLGFPADYRAGRGCYTSPQRRGRWDCDAVKNKSCYGFQLRGALPEGIHDLLLIWHSLHPSPVVHGWHF